MSMQVWVEWSLQGRIEVFGDNNFLSVTLSSTNPTQILFVVLEMEEMYKQEVECETSGV
jgi:hypothetical protein